MDTYPQILLVEFFDIPQSRREAWIEERLLNPEGVQLGVRARKVCTQRNELCTNGSLQFVSVGGLVWALWRTYLGLEPRGSNEMSGIVVVIVRPIAVIQLDDKGEILPRAGVRRARIKRDVGY